MTGRLPRPVAKPRPATRPLAGYERRKRLLHFQRVGLGHRAHRTGAGDGERVGAGQARGRAGKVTRGRVQAQATGQCAGRDPVIRALADGTHLVGRRACAAIGADRGAEVGRGQFARGGKDMIGDRRPGRADRQARACRCT